MKNSRIPKPSSNGVSQYGLRKQEAATLRKIVKKEKEGNDEYSIPKYSIGSNRRKVPKDIKLREALARKKSIILACREQEERFKSPFQRKSSTNVNKEKSRIGNRSSLSNLNEHSRKLK